MREWNIEQQVCGFAEQQGWLVRKLQWVGRKGAPDRLFVRGGVVLFVEFKKPSGAPDPMQAREIARLRGKGAEVHVVDSIEAGRDLLA